MSWVLRFAKSSIGAKIVMAISGVALFAFVAQHMLANLQLYLGAEVFNSYAYELKEHHAWLVWTGRAGLLVMFLIHVASSLRLTSLNRAARPEAYAEKHSVRAPLASRTMMLSGLVVFAYVVYHLMQFTFGVTNPEQFAVTDALGRHDAYRMTVTGFQNVAVSVFYIIANALVGLHLSHGASSMLLSLGVRRVWRPFGPLVGGFIALGFIAVPVGVLTGIIHL